MHANLWVLPGACRHLSATVLVAFGMLYSVCKVAYRPPPRVQPVQCLVVELHLFRHPYTHHAKVVVRLSLMRFRQYLVRTTDFFELNGVNPEDVNNIQSSGSLQYVMKT